MSNGSLNSTPGDQAQLLMQVGRAVLQWQNVENALATLFAAVFRPKTQAQWHALEAVMHTMMARGKINAIGAAAKHALHQEPALAQACDVVLKRAGTLADKRNDAAHSTWMIEIVTVTDTRDGSETFEVGGNVVAPHPLGRRKGNGASASHLEADADAFASFAHDVYALASRIDPRGGLMPASQSDH